MKQQLSILLIGLLILMGLTKIGSSNAELNKSMRQLMLCKHNNKEVVVVKNAHAIANLRMLNVVCNVCDSRITKDSLYLEQIDKIY